MNLCIHFENGFAFFQLNDVFAVLIAALIAALIAGLHFCVGWGGVSLVIIYCFNFLFSKSFLSIKRKKSKILTLI